MFPLCVILGSKGASALIDPCLVTLHVHVCSHKRTPFMCSSTTWDDNRNGDHALFARVNILPEASAEAQ